MNVVDNEHPAKTPEGHQVYQLSLKNLRGLRLEMQNSRRHQLRLRCLLRERSRDMKAWQSAMFSTPMKCPHRLDRLKKIRCLVYEMETKLFHP